MLTDRPFGSLIREDKPTKDLWGILDRHAKPITFDAIRIKLAAPQKIRDWSHGEVKKPETINYRTFKPERDGLFCARIFGPTKDYECACGKYKRMKFAGVVCDKCGVEVTRARVRRERMGHIELASPVSHVWFFKGLPSRIGQLLDMSLRELEKILYFEEYVVLDSKIPATKKKDLVAVDKARKLQEEHGPDALKVGMGAEAIRELLRDMDLDSLARDLRAQMLGETSVQKRKKIVKRLKVIEAFLKSGNQPEWMILEVIPVIPPELRPLVPLDGGRFATSDLNDLYRRVINRNNRLKRLMDLKAPEIIIRNEKRMLQEAVDALFDNGRRGRVITGPNNRPLKSLSDTLKGKQGRFRQNLLGKRVDYSGRSVIVVGPYLKLHQCGLPKKMALELFKPFILRKLEERGIASSIKAAKKFVEKERPEVWDILEDVIKEHPVLLNRAPTLHRLGIQAFEPILVEGKAIEIHPLVCTAFNADFDGDQMAVHVPLSMEAQLEAQVLMLSSNNILSPANGAPLAVPTQDMVLGIYYLTKERLGTPERPVRGEGRLFPDPEEVRIAYDNEDVDLQARIRLRWSGEVLETTVGRTLFNGVVPEPLRFVNQELKKKEITALVGRCYNLLGNEVTVAFLDELKDVGFRYATLSGLSIGIDDMHIPSSKERHIASAREQVNEVEQQYQDGVITNGERYNKVVDIWAHVTELISEEMFRELEAGEQGGEFNPIYMMADSGARGSKQQIRQLAGMRGLMAKPSGEIIETPITSNFREGLTVLEYFTSTHGARKGLADTALKTADSGYLTRRLVDVSQDVIVSEYDCGTVKYIETTPLVEGGDIIQSLRDRILGRVAAEDIRDPLSGEIIVQVNTEITEELAQKIEDSGLERVRIRSTLTCDTKRGICVMCYGRNLGTGRLAELGEAVGIIAAQSIGEPGTQLTMRTFHIGGTASRVVEASKHESKSAGVVKYHNLRTVVNRDGDLVATNRNGEIGVADDRGRERERYPVVYGAKIKVKADQRIKARTVLVEWDPFTNPILTEFTGRVEYQEIVEGVTVREEFDEVTGLARKVVIEDPEGKLQPGIIIRSADPENASGERHRYPLPVGANLAVADGTEVFAADIIAKIPRETTKTKDITGGLPRVAELFEARKPKEQAVITEIDGRVEMGGFVKGMRKIVIRADNGETREYLIPRGKHISVHEGDRVRAGEPLMDGSPNPHDYLAVLGDRELQRYLVNEVQEVYRLQGVTINDKHIEIIVRQMLRRVRIEEVGDTEFVVGELVDKFGFQEENERVIAQGKRPATAKPVLLGITKASLSTDSFISAASFQETTRVLTEAAISGKTDELRGLKENVIVGRLIPAGTGLSNYTRVEVLTPGGEAVKTLDSVLSLTPPPVVEAGESEGNVAAAG
ncbi:MAG: DNA-directed RNA polymerase subunit beta' [Candidatus Rokubacteria bacterium 13_1_40CM_4_69_39]|nr:MAG: DNA-directed RNA polymerase subunit beta' [Candidatus Rokubacteria bacterium 13_1_40CM_4_69_39]OLC94438.1 MAG: DNA-directed RNA polymerase subunit beta' [Candidatus Rokubacteria bacterium 13_1_40CM_3_69_38]